MGWRSDDRVITGRCEVGDRSMLPICPIYMTEPSYSSQIKKHVVNLYIII